jgi:aminopeptidase-like protein
MDITALRRATDVDALGTEMYALVEDLFPLCRSITGDGLRETLRRIGDRIPLQVEEVPTGSRAFDWTVPNEWTIRDAFVRDRHGYRVIDFNRSNLHVVGYSVPVDARMTLAELRPNLHTVPGQPDLVPYRTSYYSERWGFCLSHNQLRELEALGDDEQYEVRIDSTLAPGSLSYGELVIPGATANEILISCHACHPSLCNDNLSAISVAATLARLLSGASLRLTYRFLFAPGTIGAIVWLARNREATPRIRHGLVLANLGDRGSFTYKRSRQGNAVVDRAVTHVLSCSGRPHRTQPFSPYGYDERQYCSPGFNLPMGSLMRTPHGEFPEYHTSGDNLALVAPDQLAESLALLIEILEVLEREAVYVSTNPLCEPQLGRRGLYRSMGGQSDAGVEEMPLLWTLNLSDGQHTVLEIAERSGLPFDAIVRAVDALVDAELLVRLEDTLEDSAGVVPPIQARLSRASASLEAPSPH